MSGKNKVPAPKFETGDIVVCLIENSFIKKGDIGQIESSFIYDGNIYYIMRNIFGGVGEIALDYYKIANTSLAREIHKDNIKEIKNDEIYLNKLINTTIDG